MVARISQIGVELAVIAADPKARVSRGSFEALYAPASVKARVTRGSLEAMSQPVSKARVTHGSLEVLSSHIFPGPSAIGPRLTDNNYYSPNRLYWFRVFVPYPCAVKGIRFYSSGANRSGPVKALLASNKTSTGYRTMMPDKVIALTAEGSVVGGVSRLHDLLFGGSIQIGRGYYWLGFNSNGVGDDPLNTGIDFYAGSAHYTMLPYHKNVPYGSEPAVGDTCISSLDDWTWDIWAPPMNLLTDSIDGDYETGLQLAQTSLGGNIVADVDFTSGIILSKFTVTEAGYAHWLLPHFYRDRLPIKALVYADTGSGPGALLQESPRFEGTSWTYGYDGSPSALAIPFQRGGPLLTPDTYYAGIMFQETNPGDAAGFSLYEDGETYFYPLSFGAAPATFPTTGVTANPGNMPYWTLALSPTEIPETPAAETSDARPQVMII